MTAVCSRELIWSLWILTARVLHLQQGELCINAMVNIPVRYSFPFGYCHGLSLVMHQPGITKETSDLLRQFRVDLSCLGLDLDLEEQWYICKTPAHMMHIFQELYAAKIIEPVVYLYGSAEIEALICAVFSLAASFRMNKHSLLFAWAEIYGLIMGLMGYLLLPCEFFGHRFILAWMLKGRD